MLSSYGLLIKLFDVRKVVIGNSVSLAKDDYKFNGNDRKNRRCTKVSIWTKEYFKIQKI